MILDESLFESIEGDKIAQDTYDSKNINFEKDKENERQVKLELAKQGIVKESIKGNTRQQSFTNMLKDLGIDTLGKLKDLLNELRVDPDYKDMFKGDVNEYEIIRRYYDEVNPQGRNIANEDLQAKNIAGENLTFRFDGNTCYVKINGEEKQVDVNSDKELQDLKDHLTTMGFVEIKDVTEEALKEDMSTNQTKLAIMDSIVDYLVDNFGITEAIIRLYEQGVSEEDMLVLGFDVDEVEDALEIVNDKDSLSSLKEDLSQEQQQEYGLNTLINQLIKSEYDAIDEYNSAIVTLETENQGEYTDVIRSIIEDERHHIGNLQEIMDRITPGTTSEFEKGKEEAEETLGEDTKEDTTTTIDTEENVIKTYKLDSVKNMK